MPTHIKAYTKTHKIISIWNNSDNYFKSKLIYFLTKKTNFSFKDINILYSGISDKDFMKKFLIKYTPSDIAEKQRGINKADSIFWFLQKVFFWSTNPFPDKYNYLDIGCGEGWITESLGKMIEANEICGVELSNDYVTGESKKKSKSFISFIDNDDKLPFPDNHFYFVSCILSYHHFENRDHMLSEIRRVLQPGGFLYMREHNV